MTMKRNLLALTLAFSLPVFVSGCSSVGDMFDSDEKKPLEGDRISVLELAQSLEPEDPVLEENGLIAPAAWRNEFWPQAGGYPNHTMQHLDLGQGELAEVWSVDIGQGSTDELPLTAQPIIVDGRIFTLDTDSKLSAFQVSDGKKLWERNIAAKDEDDPVIAGGMAFSDGRLYVTNGFSELIAVNPEDGKFVWRKHIAAPSRAAPTVINGRIFITTLDNRLLALNAADGAVLWEHSGLSETAALVGGASPAANNDIVIPVFSSGEIAALRVANGSVAWSDNLSNLRNFGGLESMADIKGLPVIDKGLVIAISFSGRLVALDERTGVRVWQREIGGAQTPWVAGNHIFVLSSDNQLIALGRENGVIRWVLDLPRFENPDSKKNPIRWTGPVFAGERLILAGTGGRVVEVTANKGIVARNWSVGHTVSIPPVIAGGTLYLLSEDGTLSAFR